MSEVHKFVDLLNKVAIYYEIECIVRVSCHALFVDLLNKVAIYYEIECIVRVSCHALCF